MRDFNIHLVKWQVSLNNGETLYEGKGDFCDLKGEPSPWQRLQKYISENNFHITSLSLYTDLGQTWNLPSAGSNPKFREFAGLKKPIKFEMFRKMSRDLSVVNEEIGGVEVTGWYTVARVEYKDMSLEIWVDEFNTKNCWTLTRTKL
jgi:hypothetical protein